MGFALSASEILHHRSQRTPAGKLKLIVPGIMMSEVLVLCWDSGLA